MDKQQILRADYLDILFQNRNKGYGGYDLRKRYSQRARTATLIVLAGISILVAGPVIASGLEGESRLIVTAETPIHFVPPPPKATEKALPVQVSAPRPVPTVIRNPVFVIAKPDEVTEQPPKQEDLAGKQVGIETAKGTGEESPDIIGKPGEDGPAIVEAPREDRTIYKKVEVFPLFPGDLNEYLNAHLHYLDASKENHEQGRCIIRFVVNTDGSIQDVSVARGVAPLLDAEAARVVAGMPLWKPGKQNGRAVRVEYIIPIVWKLDE